MTFRKQTLWLSGNQVGLPRLALALLATVLAVILSACSNTVNTPKATASGPQLYMTPTIYEGTPAIRYTSSPATISIDDAALTFAQQTYSAQTAAQVNYSGDLASHPLARGLKELEQTYACGATTGTCTGTTYTPSHLNPSGWAVELAGQSGGLEQLIGHQFVPMVPAVTCPSMSSAETFLFVTLPKPLGVWDPTHETAYGSVNISASGSAVTFAGINQYILPSAGGGKVTNSSSVPQGACSSTVYGNTVAVPANPTITIDPTGAVTYALQAMVGIGPSGLLVEDSGGTSYLGAGTGAIGLPKPSNTVDTGSLVGAQYLGFFYGTGSSGSTPNGFSSVASFGFPTLPSSCKTLMAQIAAKTTTSLVNPIYGGDFPVNTTTGLTTTGLPDPGLSSVQANGGYGNCDFVIDLGTESSTTNGLYEGATVWVGAGTATNTSTTIAYPIPAVAIAGTLNGKYAIFLVGEDTVGSPNQAWGIYLLQSN